MNKYKLVIYFIIVIALVSLVYLTSYFKKIEIEATEKEGEAIINKIELFKKQNHRLPAYLDELKPQFVDDSVFSYDRSKDSINYVLGFGIGGFDSRVYDSGTKKWKDLLD